MYIAEYQKTRLKRGGGGEACEISLRKSKGSYKNLSVDIAPYKIFKIFKKFLDAIIWERFRNISMENKKKNEYRTV